MQSSKISRRFEWMLRYLDSVRQRRGINDPFGSTYPDYDQLKSLDGITEFDDTNEPMLASIKQLIRSFDTMLLRIIILEGRRELMTIRLQRWWRHHYYGPNGTGFRCAQNHFKSLS
jgi:hypothetical protein